MEQDDLVLDATQIQPHALKHQLIFERFDSLKDGEYFILHNDHDPLPLYYQFQAIHGDTFDWEYLIEGPIDWEVQITRKLKPKTEPTVGQMVAEDFRKAGVFHKYGIDFCCSGKDNLTAACKIANVNYHDVVKDLEELDREKEKKQNNYNNWELDFLSDYIVNNHHHYVRNSIPMLREFSAKVARVHGENHPEVIDVATHFEALADEMLEHMNLEEKYLFPYVKKLVKARNNEEKLAQPNFGSIDKPIQVQGHLEEHDQAGNHMKEIHKLTNGYTLPEDACNTYRTLYAKLDEFEKDLYQHIHLENNILFDKAIALEKEVVK